eukprot:CAMPEP_0206490014 /NCGR_PEP_ID=MMETSP0324_2-20121206/43720_1 /ASSEMBLY_ACC=CAM_ASM_000836 /TAXON_ID=2866 /ORGANISM="Crypthecodinium cohnii, Strain Seligo" /LENGTH=58 /DNA_ID=CAMNT_0053970077 /DNA_START=245 /DNA_END=421 /DNA_ORIENTATION=-
MSATPRTMESHDDYRVTSECHRVSGSCDGIKFTDLLSIGNGSTGKATPGKQAEVQLAS